MKSDRISQEEFHSWYQITLRAFTKIWIVVFAVEVFLFLFFKPNAECGRIRYLWLFVIKPSGIMAIALILVKLYSVRKKRNFRKFQASLSTIILVSSFCAAAIWIHTSVRLMSMLLMLPLIITTLYKNYILTWIQLFICVFIFVMYELYFYPNTPYMPPLNDFINITIFCGSVIVELFLIQHVQAYVETTSNMVNLDTMTGLHNHTIFYEELESACQKAKKRHRTVSLLVIDIDKFKNINDTYGHAFGDQIICDVADILKKVEQQYFCARYGGEEFAVILPDIPFEEAIHLAEIIRTEFASHQFETSDGKKSFSMSIGAAEYQSSFYGGSDLFKAADHKLYEAKQNGRNQVRY